MGVVNIPACSAHAIHDFHGSLSQYRFFPLLSPEFLIFKGGQTYVPRPAFFCGVVEKQRTWYQLHVHARKIL